MSDLYIESRLQAIAEIANGSCDKKDADNIMSFCEEINQHISEMEGTIEQIKWERDVAINQLKAMGYSLGEKQDAWHNVLNELPEDGQEVWVTTEYPASIQLCNENIRRQLFVTRYSANVSPTNNFGKKSDDRIEYETWHYDTAFQGNRVIAWMPYRRPVPEKQMTFSYE